MFKYVSKRRYPITWDKAFVISVGIFGLVVLALIVKHLMTSKLHNNEIEKTEFETETLFWTPGCAIPDLSINNSKIEKFFFEMPPIVCNKGVEPLFELNLSSIYLLRSSLPAYNVTLDTLNCCYQYFKNINLEDKQKVQIKYAEKCVELTENLKLDENEEMVRVTCTRRGDIKKSKIYEDYFHFISTKTEDFNRSQDHLKDQLSILMVGIDAVSRVNLYRQMPKTVAYLAKLEAVEMLGYNKIADNTYPNLLVVLTGHNANELEDGCWPAAKPGFDGCEYIWNKFRARGFSTAYGEDLGKFFYFYKSGVKLEPLDHYYNPYAAERAIGNHKGLYYQQCTGSRLSYEVILQYAMDYVLTMRNAQRKFFGFFWTGTLTHDYLNAPKLGDDGFANWLHELESSGVLNHTALIFMSDHGMRQGAFRNTHQGYLEENLPFLFVVLPKWYRDQEIEAFNNLKTNARRLVTPYDLYETLLDIGNVQKNRKVFIGNLSRGISLTRPITNKRTCQDAGIESHWCACKPRHIRELNAAHIVDAVQFTIKEHINRLLADYPECVQLKLWYHQKGRSVASSEQVEGKTKVASVDIRVWFRTSPGHGTFEATVRKTTSKNSNKFGVIGTVSRLNSYGNQSRCVQDPYVKMFCYCKGN